MASSTTASTPQAPTSPGNTRWGSRRLFGGSAQRVSSPRKLSRNGSSSTAATTASSDYSGSNYNSSSSKSDRRRSSSKSKKSEKSKKKKSDEQARDTTPRRRFGMGNQNSIPSSPVVEQRPPSTPNKTPASHRIVPTSASLPVTPGNNGSRRTLQNAPRVPNLIQSSSLGVGTMTQAAPPTYHHQRPPIPTSKRRNQQRSHMGRSVGSASSASSAEAGPMPMNASTAFRLKPPPESHTSPRKSRTQPSSSATPNLAQLHLQQQQPPQQTSSDTRTKEDAFELERFFGANEVDFESFLKQQKMQEQKQEFEQDYKATRSSGSSKKKKDSEVIPVDDKKTPLALEDEKRQDSLEMLMGSSEELDFANFMKQPPMFGEAEPLDNNNAMWDEVPEKKEIPIEVQPLSVEEIGPSEKKLDDAEWRGSPDVFASLLTPSLPKFVDEDEENDEDLLWLSSNTLGRTSDDPLPSLQIKPRVPEVPKGPPLRVPDTPTTVTATMNSSILGAQSSNYFENSPGGVPARGIVDEAEEDLAWMAAPPRSNQIHEAQDESVGPAEVVVKTGQSDAENNKRRSKKSKKKTSVPKQVSIGRQQPIKPNDSVSSSKKASTTSRASTASYEEVVNQGPGQALRAYLQANGQDESEANHMAKAFEKFLKERRKQEMQLLAYRMEDENDKKKKAKEESENCIIENGTFLLKEKEIIIDFMQENGLDESTLGGTFQDTHWENGTFMSFPEQLPPPPERPQYREPPHPSTIDPRLAQPPQPNYSGSYGAYVDPRYNSVYNYGHHPYHAPYRNPYVDYDYYQPAPSPANYPQHYYPPHYGAPAPGPPPMETSHHSSQHSPPGQQGTPNQSSASSRERRAETPATLEHQNLDRRRPTTPSMYRSSPHLGYHPPPSYPQPMDSSGRARSSRWY